MDYTHRTSDLWEAVAIHAAGYPIIATHRNERGDVVFEFPNGGDDLYRIVTAHRRGDLKINSLALNPSYHTVRSELGRELRNDRSS